MGGTPRAPGCSWASRDYVRADTGCDSWPSLKTQLCYSGPFWHHKGILPCRRDNPMVHLKEGLEGQVWLCSGVAKPWLRWAQRRPDCPSMDQIALTWPKSAYIEVPKTLFPWLQAERSHGQPGPFCPYRRISPLTR